MLTAVLSCDLFMIKWSFNSAFSRFHRNSSVLFYEFLTPVSRAWYQGAWACPGGVASRSS